MDYDPNMNSCGRTTKQTVKLTFGRWKYRAEHTVEVGGNVRGFGVLEAAITILYDQLPPMSDGMGGRAPGMVMVEPGGNVEDGLYCTDDEDEGEHWLQDLCIGAEIIAIRQDRDLYAEVATESASS